MAKTSLFDVARVKLIRKKLKGSIKKLHPEWHDIDGYFCFPSPKYFAVGFLLDHKPYASEINLFAVPLFSKVVGFNLSYADIIRGEEGRIDIRGKNATSIAQEFSSKVSHLKNEVMAKDDLNWFVKKLEENNALRNTRLKYDYGLALILLNRFQEAEAVLNEVSNCEWEKRVVPEEAENADMLSKILSSDPKAAFNEVKEYLERNIYKFGFNQ